MNRAQENLNQLESLNVDYDELLKKLQKDPNSIERIAPAALGVDPVDANTIYPKVTAQQLLDAAKEALAKNPKNVTDEPIVPEWLNRCREPGRRGFLLAAGAFLILISFIWFGSNKQVDESVHQ